MATPRMADDRGRAPLRPRRPGRQRPLALARPEPTDVSVDRQDDGEVRRRRRESCCGRRRVPNPRRIWLVQRCRPRALRPGDIATIVTEARTAKARRWAPGPVAGPPRRA